MQGLVLTRWSISLPTDSFMAKGMEHGLQNWGLAPSFKQLGLELLDSTELCLENVCIVLAKVTKSQWSIVNWLGPITVLVDVDPLQQS